MSTLTKEWLLKTIAELEEEHDATPGAVNEDAANALAAMKLALASLELERGMIRRFDLDMSDCDSCGQDCGADMVEDLDGEYVLWDEVLPHLYRYDEYTAPPATVSVPDGMLKNLLPDAEKPEFWFEHNGTIFFEGVKFNNAVFDACRAAMLQGADGTLTNEGTIPVTQFKPVADLYGLTSPTGGETSFTFDAVEACDFIDGGWSCQEYVELGRFQEAVSGNSPVIPDGWVAVPVEPTIAILDEFDSIIDYGAEDSKDAWSRLLAAAWIKSLPAAPQQEVESQIRKGKTVAREEWELGARLTKHRFKP
ncbi:Uncharacterised protein [Enterobacter hormaechei]|uniref:hypothetical protein n=1 Tax=Enterobacter hormaechei TaxID=158836 RepID=UPI001256EBC0|nr:hypothetical protein [Enterobacter hormaechei]VAC38172.1 Uncharacterised protein [Enterobacter hormaechei]